MRKEQTKNLTIFNNKNNIGILIISNYKISLNAFRNLIKISNNLTYLHNNISF